MPGSDSPIGHCKTLHSSATDGRCVLAGSNAVAVRQRTSVSSRTSRGLSPTIGTETGGDRIRCPATAHRKAVATAPTHASRRL